eukprot:SAG31_NODE_2090_length_6472_cov_4.683352_3_plen_96_part_00
MRQLFGAPQLGHGLRSSDTPSTQVVPLTLCVYRILAVLSPDVIDIDGTGHITKENLRDFMFQAGQPISDEEIDQMFQVRAVTFSFLCNYQRNTGH